MADKDIISKTILKNLVRDFATYLFDLPVTEVELLETEQQRIEDRHADLVAKVKTPGLGAFILHVEIQNDNQPLMPVRMLRYMTDILLATPGLPVRQYLLYIGKDRFRMADGLQQPGLNYHYQTVDMREVDGQTLLEQDSPDAWVLAVLCDFKGRPAQDVVHAILSQLIGRVGDSPPRLREYVEMLDILATNRDLNLNIKEELAMLAVDIEKLAVYQIGMEKGVDKGIEKGIEKGISIGVEKGVEQGVHIQARVIAKKLLAQGMEPAQVAAITDLPLAEVEALRPALGG